MLLYLKLQLRWQTASLIGWGRATQVAPRAASLQAAAGSTR